MPSLADHQSNDFVKLLLLGDAKSGKTGSLVSLVKAGYRLRILDLDNLLDILKYMILAECPELLNQVEFVTLRDNYKATASGTMIDGTPKAWINSLKLLNRWKYDDIDLGVPAEWGADTILVVDSLSRWCDAAYDFHESAIPRGKSGDFDGRAVYGNAQDDVEKQLASLTSRSFRTNLIVIAHGTYMIQGDGSTLIFPQGVGQKLSPKIPQYFSNYIRYKNRAGKRTIQLESDSMINLATTNPAAMPKELDIADGLAKFFEILRVAPGKIEPRPQLDKSVNIKRIR
jgi:hypothetical protein